MGLDGQSGAFVGFRGEPGQYEVTEIVFKAKASISNGESVHFFLADGDETTTEHYIWFDVDTAGADPTESGTQHEVAIDAIATAIQVAAAVHAVINAIGGITTVASGTDGLVTLTNDYKGLVTESSIGNGTPVDSITVTQDGSDFDVANVGRGSDNRVVCPHCNGQWFMVKDSYCIDDGDVPDFYDGYNVGGVVDNIIFLCHCGREFIKPKTDWAAMLGSN